MESDRFTRHSYEDWMNETAADVERDLELETEMQDETARDAWRRWWNEEGSAERPLPNEDTEQFAKRITEIAWSNGAFKRLADVDLLRAELAAMEKQRDEARLDAERYRWLKSGGCYWVEIQSQPHGDYIFKGQAARSIGGSIDNAIDAMLAAMRKEGGGA
jgi:hypothetical protein